MVRPLGGTDDEVTGICLPIEPVEPASFDLPDPEQQGDARSCQLLRDAIRLGFRSSAGPFRSFAHLAVEPRPYQLVPLLMALKLDPIRLLIADDVGIGKTIEAALIARELIDRDEAQRLAVLCPPHLAEQWQAELASKFHIEAELVLSSTASRLERHCGINESLFDYYPYVVVSTDFIKSDRRRDEFLRTCPELVIVDEAHTCAFGGEGRGSRHQRYKLINDLSANQNRHLILVTATPHSGNEDAFRSLLGLLKAEFRGFPEDLSGKEHEPFRRKLADHFVQRRRVDILNYLDAETVFPERKEREVGYRLSPEYKQFFNKVLRYARESVRDESGGFFRQRVRWWSALALLRAIASSPAAASATLRSRAASAEAETEQEVDDIGRRTVLDLMDNESAEAVDLTPGSDYDDTADAEAKNRRKLLEMAREADTLRGASDKKLLDACDLVKSLVKDGFQPIVFCRFIDTAEYVADALREKLPNNVQVMAVTGTLPPAEREHRVKQLGETEKRVLVCTDCLSEGINLQDHFNAVVHYDLSWNPTRHEQREGRVDRYGQEKSEIRVVTYYGLDNQIDGIILDVLLRKQRTIRNSLGISVPVPVNTEEVVEAIFEGLLLRETTGHSVDDQLTMFQEFFQPKKEDVHSRWDLAAEKEKRSRTMFAQEGIKVDEVARELAEMRDAIGSGIILQRFMHDALRASKAIVSDDRGVMRVDLTETSSALRDVLGNLDRFSAKFELPVKENELYLTRTHPLVESLAGYVMNTTLDEQLDGIARRCGAMRTRGVSRITTLLLLRLRYHIVTRIGGEERPLLAEDCRLLAFEGVPNNPTWLDEKAAEAVMQSMPDANVSPEQAKHFLTNVLNDFTDLHPHLDEMARQRGEALLEAHRRVRTAAQMKGITYRVEPQLPPDVLGMYVYLPA
ncbi:MAG: helicase-related protein [Armatimonadota bacterium]